MCNSYMDLPDAPWIREAETYGPPMEEEISYSCPVCGADEPEDFVFDRSGDIVGCNCCCHFRDAYEYMAQKRADERYAV
jgi:hypothetical protein